MRSLNTSLPRDPRPTSSQPPEQLLQAFKTAALSVTNLYKTAASDQARARQHGYQDALDDLLLFLDKEHLGLGDGEGWKVRRWATERLDGSSAGGAACNESDDERGEAEKRARSDSPVTQLKSSKQDTILTKRQEGSISPIRMTSAPLPAQAMPPPPTSVPLPAPEIFHFRSPQPLPQDIDMISSDTSTASSMAAADMQTLPTVPTPPPSVRVEVVPRGSRTPHRNSTGHGSRHNTRAATVMNRRSLGAGAGSKRRLDFNDYFDLGSLDGPGGGGGKRGRYE
ncbi:MAG: hypothetical protein Q9218_007178 [Villophora microphyllina]